MTFKGIVYPKMTILTIYSTFTRSKLILSHSVLHKEDISSICGSTFSYYGSQWVAKKRYYKNAASWHSLTSIDCFSYYGSQWVP